MGQHTVDVTMVASIKGPWENTQAILQQYVTLVGDNNLDVPDNPFQPSYAGNGELNFVLTFHKKNVILETELIGVLTLFIISILFQYNLTLDILFQDNVKDVVAV